MRSAFRSLLASAVIGAFAFAAPAAAQQKVKIGFITTFSGPQGVMGQYMKESVELAIEHLGGKVGGLPVEMFYGDSDLGGYATGTFTASGSPRYSERSA